ncbi:MAG: hypothetical protein AB8G05_07405 [Oligoflexales bacterium]
MNTIENKDSYSEKSQLSLIAIQDFYVELEAALGPSLNSVDRKFLESADAELAEKNHAKWKTDA